MAKRIVVLSLVLLFLIQAAVFIAVRLIINSTVQTQVASNLEVGERVWNRLLEQNAQKLRQNAALLALDYGFQSALSSNDDATIHSALENNEARVGASISALLDTNLQIRTLGGGKDAPLLQPVLSTLTAPLALDAQGSRIALIDGRVYQFVMVPMKQPVVVGWILMGFVLDQAVANDMHTLSGIHVVLITRTANGQASAPVSTLPVEAARALMAQQGVRSITFDGDTLIVRSGQQVALAGQVQTLFLGSLNEVVAPFKTVQIALAVITVLGLISFALGSTYTANRVTTPLRSLVAAAERLGRGEYEKPLQLRHQEDEIGDLAKAFDQMRIDIARNEAEIVKLAYWDTLTGLPNRVRFRDDVQRAISRKNPLQERTEANRTPHASLAVIILDLDRFKHVNDVLGYAFGDRLLKGVTQRLSQLIRSVDDVVARLGGNQFAVLLSHTDVDNAIAVAGRIAASFEQPLALEDHTVDLSAGIGIACWPQHATEVDTLLSRAEAAMYSAKRKTTGLQIYDENLDASSTQSLSMLTELRQAVESGELRLYLQPKIGLMDNRVRAAEALVRWQHPQRGLLAPFAFIPFAEQTGFVRQLTLWMFEAVARLWSDLDAGAPGLRVAINLSTRDLLDQDFPSKLDSIMRTYGVTSDAFCLEITESAIMDDPQRAENTLNQLAGRGFKLSIDDFGTGYSSLAYLKHLPVDELKIDKSFVMGMESDQDDAKIVRSTIDLAHNLGLTVVAEGVENAAILELLRGLNCDEAQGYFMSKPLPAPDFFDWLTAWKGSVTQANGVPGLAA